MIKKFHILVIDDDTRLRALLGKFLEENGFTVSLTKDAMEARELMLNNNYDLLVVDVMMPNEDGVTFTSKVRESSKLPILMLTARGEPDDRIKGLEAGADDYLPKPFEPKELLLRINNILRYRGISTTSVIDAVTFGNFSFSTSEAKLKKGEDFIYLTESEAKILSVLCQDKGNVVSREKLTALCGGIDDRSIDVQITRLRKKIESNTKQSEYLQTVRNQGYVLRG